MHKSSQRILVTGAGGFVGSRLCEALTLSGHRATVTGLIHNTGRAARIGRLPLTLAKGDITDRQFVNEQIKDMDFVVHLALGGRSGIINGTKVLARAALDARVKCFVHMSSAAVCASRGLQWRNGTISEDVEISKTGNPYADAKIEAEKVIAKYQRRGLPAVILRPGIVFGPYSFWVKRVVNAARKGAVVLVDDGMGMCETTYIDNLIHSILCCLMHSESAGNTFFIGDDEPVRWRDFKEPVAKAVNPNVEFLSVPSTGRDIDLERDSYFVRNVRGIKNLLLSSELRAAVSDIPLCQSILNLLLTPYYRLPESEKLRLKGLLGLQTVPQLNCDDNVEYNYDDICRESGQGRLSIENAKRRIDYRPIVSFKDGLDVVLEWVRYTEERNRNLFV